MADGREIVRLTISTEELDKVRTRLVGINNGVNRALAGAINRTLAKGKTATKRGLLQLLTIKSRQLDHRLIVKKATSSKLSGKLSIMGRPAGLHNFDMRDTTRRGARGVARGSGVIGQVFRSGPQIALPHAFIATGRFGNVQVFQRVGASRLPIKTQFSQSLFDIFQTSPLAKTVPAGMQEDLDGQIDSQINRLLSGH